MYWNCIENYALILWYLNENDIYFRKKSKGLILYIIVFIYFYLYRFCLYFIVVFILVSVLILYF